MTDNDFGEERANCRQRIESLEARVEKLLVPLSEGGLNTLSLSVARLVDDEFAKHHEGGRTQRLAKIQVIVREAIREATTGERAWDAWSPGSPAPAPSEPAGEA
jgi:hypothetical protein